MCGPAVAQGLSGAYLAARQASILNEFSVAADYNARVLGYDRENTFITESLAMAYIGLGKVSSAITVANAMANAEDKSQILDLLVLVDLIQREKYDEILVGLDTTLDVNYLVANLIQPWAVAGTGDIERAAALFDGFPGDDRMAEFFRFHKAMMYAAVGDYEAALPIFETVDLRFRGIGVRAFMARLQIMLALGDREGAIALFDSTYDPSNEPELAQIRAELTEGVMPYGPVPQTISQGMAEVFLSIAVFVTTESEPIFSLLYARLAQALLPTTDAQGVLISATMLEDLGQFDLAVREYNKIPADHPRFYSSELARFDAMMANDNRDLAIESLEQLVRLRPDIGFGYAALGDALRRSDRNEDAKAAYDTAIELFSAVGDDSWRLYYARGIVHSNLDDWPASEADFRKALELNPDQPQVLNYLGYSMVEKRIDLTEALEMIQTAVDKSPDSGYIIDSLGWAKFRLGRYDEAVPHLERAAELMPVDPIVNDHLGDAYWAVGRKREAEFQWRRALSFDPEPKEINRIRRKLEVGLDQVLIEEGESPTTTTAEK